MGERIAYLTARFPPMRTSGTFRVEAILEHLPRHGFDLVPVTIPDDWMAQQAGRRLPPVRADGVRQPESASDATVRRLASIPIVRRVLREALLPDILAVWARSVPSGLAESLEDVRLVYATSPPFSTMLLADRLASLLGVPCIQEIRDPPSFNRRLRGRSRMWQRRMFRYEKRFLSKADAVIAVTDGTRRRLLANHPELDADRCFVVTNGYPVIEVDLSLAGRDTNRFTVTYVGSFQGGVKRRQASPFTPAVLLPALRALPPDRARLRVVGPTTPAQRRSIVSEAGSQLVEFAGVVERSSAIAEMAAADVALVLAEDDEWWIGRKVFEALAYARRILAIVPSEGDTAQLLRGSPKATTIGLEELDRLDGVLLELYTSWSSGSLEYPTPDASVDIQTDRSCVAQVAEIVRLTLGRSTPPT